jgi:hypothetical protein
MYKIGITGKANTGKNTVSNLITEELNKDIQNYSLIRNIAFADPIKEMARQMFPILPKEYLYGSSENRAKEIPGAFKDGQPLTIRQLLIDLGTGVGREYKENLWLDVFDHTFKKAVYKKRQAVIVTDCRFRNEFDHLKKLGFFQIRLLRESHTKINHSSETNQDSIKDEEFDAVIHNNGSLDELIYKIKQIIPKIKSS